MVADEDEKQLYSDKIKSVTVNSYRQAVEVLSGALRRRATKPRSSSAAFYEPSQSHVFVTLEVVQESRAGHEETRTVNKAVLTLIDLAGFPSDETEERKGLDEDREGLWANHSLACLKQYMLNVDLYKYQNCSFASDGTSVLTQLLKQNFVNDSRIFIIGTIHHAEDRTTTRASLVRTLTFCNKFRNIIGRLLYLSTEQGALEASCVADPSVVEPRPTVGAATHPEPSAQTAIPAGNKNGNVSFCTNASTERQQRMKPSILALNKALRVTLRKCLDCHNVSTATSCYVINKTLEQLNLNLDERMVDFNVLDVDIEKLHAELDQNLDAFLTLVDGRIDSADDMRARGEIERLSQNISKLLFQAIAKMCYLSAEVPKSRRQGAVIIEKILHNNLCRETDLSARAPDVNSRIKTSIGEFQLQKRCA